MRPREVEHYIEIPLSEYRKLVEELAETKVYLSQRSEENFFKLVELKETNEKLSELSNLYERVVVELEGYKKLYDKEEE